MDNHKSHDQEYDSDGSHSSGHSNNSSNGVHPELTKKNSMEVITPNDGPKEVPLISDQEVTEDNRSGLIKVLTKVADLTTVPIPVTFNEPASFLMRLCEAIQYSDLLDKAADCEDPLERLMYVAIFACSLYAVAERIGKPFNPLLGETFEYSDPSHNNFRFVAEQVSHHPPVAACLAETEHWKFWQAQSLKTRFTGNSLDCSAIGSVNVLLKKTNEHFKWEGVKTVVHNLIIGKLWLDHFGDLEVINKTTKEKAVIHMKECGWFSKGWHEVEGDVFDSNGDLRITIFGKWNEAIYAKFKGEGTSSQDDSDSNASFNDEQRENEESLSKKEKKLKEKKEKKEKKELKEREKKEKKEKKKIEKLRKKELKKKIMAQEPLWVRTNKALTLDQPENKYMVEWTAHTLQLVELPKELEQILPATDCRLRPDRIALEKGDGKKAGAEKYALEEKQRRDKRLRDQNGKTWEPKYFKEAVDEDGQTYWQYMGGYWEQKDERMKNLHQKS